MSTFRQFYLSFVAVAVRLCSGFFTIATRAFGDVLLMIIAMFFSIVLSSTTLNSNLNTAYFLKSFTND